MGKIAFCGVHGSGKTTVWHELCAKFKKEGRVFGTGYEVERMCPYPLNEKGSFQSQLWIVTERMRMETNLSKKYENILLDRSILDTLPYTHYLNEQNKISEYEFVFIKNLVKKWILYAPYEMIYVFPVTIEFLKNDGVRSDDTIYWNYIKNLFDDYTRYITRDKMNIIRLDFFDIRNLEKMIREEWGWNK